MEEQTPDVKPEEAKPTEPSTQEKQPVNVSEDVKTPEGESVPKDVYENVKTSMQKEREEKRESQALNKELEDRIVALESQQREEDVDPIEQPIGTTDPKTEVLWLMNQDPFVKDNLDLIEAKMSESNLGVQAAATAVKAEFFDRIQKELPSSPSNKPQLQEQPTATAEQVIKPVSSQPFKDAIEGKLDVDPRQLEAVKRQLPRE